jgi:hypothetical protein
MTNGLTVPLPREGHRRTFSEPDKRRIVDATMRPGTTLSEEPARRSPALELVPFDCPEQTPRVRNERLRPAVQPRPRSEDAADSPIAPRIGAAAGRQPAAAMARRRSGARCRVTNRFPLYW